MARFMALLTLTLGLTATSFANDSVNVALLTNMIEVINDRNLDALDALVAENVVRHSASTPGVAVTNLAEFKAFLEADYAVSSDAKQTIEVIFGSGDMVAVRAIYAGTQTGPMGPFPASGRQMEIPFNGIARIENGKIAELWAEWDNLSALTQLGHFPPKTQETSGE